MGVVNNMGSCILWERNYWTDPDFEGCGAVAKSLYVYFCGSLQTNILGICKASMKRIKDETEFTEAQITTGVARLVKLEKMEADPAANLYWVRAGLKRERKLSQDRFFKGVIKEIFALQDHPISRNFLRYYAPILLSQKTDRCFTEADRARLLALIEKSHGPSSPIQEPYMAPKAKDKDKAMVLTSSLLFEDQEAIANTGPGNPLSPPPIEAVILAYWKTRVQSRYGTHVTAGAQTIANIKKCLEEHDARDLLGAIAKYGSKMDADSDRKDGGDPFPVKGSNFFGKAAHFQDYLPTAAEQEEHRKAAEVVIAGGLPNA